MRARRLLILAALLPGLGLAGVGGLRVCLSALVGVADCCASPEVASPSCCSSARAPGGEAPERPEQPAEPAQDECAWCCVEFEEGAPLAEGAPRVHVEPLLAALAPIPAPWRALGPARTAPARIGSPRSPPGAGANLPLRI